MFGPLQLFDIHFQGVNLRIKAWRNNILAAYPMGQYRYACAGNIVTPQEGDHIIDAGGCFGDNALSFAVSAGETGRVYVFDMLPVHLRIIHDNLRMNPAVDHRIKVLGYGLDGTSNTMPEVVPAQASEKDVDPAAQLSNGNFPLRSIDDLVASGVVERVDFIKMDIEGSELAALQGAEKTLKTMRPKLAISLYHKPEDFFTIPDYIDSLGVGYRFYLGHYTIHAGETVLYAKSEE